MKKTASLLLLAASLATGSAFAQEKCATNDMHKQYIKEDPSLAEKERQFNLNISRVLSHMDPTTFGRTTSATDTIIEIPVVVHIQHSYGTSDYLTDESVYALIKRMNNTYSLNYDTSSVIAPFKKYVGKANIRFHLATIDPNGQPTKGITRRFTYLTVGGDDQVKMDQWSPINYYNIWFENVIGRGAGPGLIVAAYAQFPTDYDSRPYYDGVICAASFIGDGSTIEHETGHYFSLLHPWNNNAHGGALTAGDCGDDEVDDTPPTTGHQGGCALYDTTCANNYYKVYSVPVYDTNAITHLVDSVMVDRIVNYPDTINVQNIMDYADCELMFTKGQVYRMRYTLGDSSLKRYLLRDATNLSITGALAPAPDLLPIPDFFPVNPSSGNKMQYFTCPGTPLKFVNKSWRDTVTNLDWTFDHGATSLTSTITNPTFLSTVTNSFTEQGWVNISMAATGNHTGIATDSFNHSIYVADAIAKNASDVIEEFSPEQDLAKWPTFNYYSNGFKWQPSYAGFYDSRSMMYTGFDTRVNPTLGIFPVTGTPKGDFDDFFSIPVDLSGFGTTGACNMDFFTSAASRSSNSLDINDTMTIAYSTDHGKTWVNMSVLTKSDLINKGATPVFYVPTSTTDWVARTINIPAAARLNYVVFRFRYQPGVDHNGFLVSTGNNFYMDRLSFSTLPAGVNDVKMDNLDAVVIPNPTNSNAYVVVKDAGNASAHITVSDIAGKVVYTTTEQLIGSEARIEIPQSALQAKGIYMVQTTTGGMTKTQKLVVY